MGSRTPFEQMSQSAAQMTEDKVRYTNTTCMIWGPGKILGDGRAATGFIPNTRYGPCVQVVPLAQYQKHSRDILKRSKEKEGVEKAAMSRLRRVERRYAAFKEGGIPLGADQGSIIRYHDNVILPALLEAKRAHEDFRAITDLEQEFAKRWVRVFKIIDSGVIRIDYNKNPDRWSVLVVGDYFSNTYCTIIPALGRPAEVKALVPKGVSSDEVISESGEGKTGIMGRVNRIQQKRGGSNILPPGGQSGVAQYAGDGDTWVAGYRSNIEAGEAAIFRTNDPQGYILKSNSQDKTEIKGSKLEIRTDPRNVSFNEFTENPLQVFGNGSNVVFDVPRFRQTIPNIKFLINIYDDVRDILDDFRKIRYIDDIQYTHEVIDYNDFIPPGRSVD